MILDQEELRKLGGKVRSVGNPGNASDREDQLARALTYWLGASSAWTGATGTADILVVAAQNFGSLANVSYYGGISFSEG